MHALRVLLLAALGLGSLYMLHLLAQDYNKIRKPAAKLAGFFSKNKRDLNAISDNVEFPKVSWLRFYFYTLVV